MLSDRNGDNKNRESDEQNKAEERKWAWHERRGDGAARLQL